MLLSTRAAPLVSAQRSDDGSTLRVLLTNPSIQPVSVSIQILGGTFSFTVHESTLSSTDLNAANPASQPTLVSPQTQTIQYRNGGAMSLPGYSFLTLVFTAA